MFFTCLFSLQNIFIKLVVIYYILYNHAFIIYFIKIIKKMLNLY